MNKKVIISGCCIAAVCAAATLSIVGLGTNKVAKADKVFRVTFGLLNEEREKNSGVYTGYTLEGNAIKFNYSNVRAYATEDSPSGVNNYLEPDSYFENSIDTQLGSITSITLENVSPSGLFTIYCGWADPVENTIQWIDSVDSSAGRGQTKTIDLSSYKPNYIKFVSTNGFGFEKGYIDFECVTSVLPD